MKRYRAVLLDMFDTLVPFRWERLPVVRIDGQDVRSTSPFVYNVMKPACPEVSLEDFCRAFVESYRTAEELRRRDDKEISARQRFQFLFERLGVFQRPEAEHYLEAGLAEHTRQLCRVMEFPQAHRTTLEHLRSRYRLAVVSNFDHGPTVELALRSFGIQDRFETVVVSADVVWRKPRPEIFLETLRRMGIGSDEAVFVGDTPEIDVIGAQGVGLDVIWIDHGTTSMPVGSFPPTKRVTEFPAILRWL